MTDGPAAPSADRALEAVLERARDHGALGPGPIGPHIEHARGFVDVAARVIGGPPRTVVDLGSGGGVPGLVLVSMWPAAAVTLIEARARRASDLEAAVVDLFGVTSRVRVLTERAEAVAHWPEYRERVQLVTARGFGPPALTAEIASGLVEPGGWLVVSEPPEEDPARWPAEGLGAMGFRPAIRSECRGAHFAAISKFGPSAAEVPRPTRALVKRPAW